MTGSTIVGGPFSAGTKIVRRVAARTSSVLPVGDRSAHASI
jgi:hypothetical protein